MCEAAGEEAIEFVEELALARGEVAFGLARQHGARTLYLSNKGDEVRGDRGCSGAQSKTSGTSTWRARSHSPRLFACPSGRVEAATPSCRIPWIKKLSDRMAGMA